MNKSLIDICKEDPGWATSRIEYLESVLAAELGQDEHFVDWWCNGDDGGTWFLEGVEWPWVVAVGRDDDSINEWYGWEWTVSDGERIELFRSGKCRTAYDAMQAAKVAWRQVMDSSSPTSGAVGQ